jgi:hypothetical protein
LLVEESRELLASMNANPGGILFRLGSWTSEVLRGFRGLDGSLPAPLFIPTAEIAELGRLAASERHARWQRLRNPPGEGPHRCSSLFLRFSSETGVMLEEMFLRFFPFDLFPPPTVQGSGAISPEEVARRWELGAEDFLISTFFETDIHELSGALREWCKNPEGDFPFRFQSNATPPPVTRSVLTMRFLRARDRVWHLDRPIVFEFRPVNQQEAYALEAAYWRSVNDDRRAELAEEIRARLGGAGMATGAQ